MGREDEDRYTDYYSRFFRKIYFYCYKRLKDSVAAEDMAQEIFVKLWQEIDKIHDAGHAEKWLSRVTRNRMVNFFRDNGRACEVSEDPNYVQEDLRSASGNDLDELMSDRESLLEIAEYIQGLDELSQKVFQCWVEKSGWRELSLQSGRSVHALHCRASRLVKKLRRKFRG